MPKFNAFALASSLVLGMQFGTAYSAAEAHAVVVPLPASHAAAAANALKSLLLHRKIATLPIAGTGSATVRLNNQIIKSLITKGYSNGQSQAINSDLGGAVSSSNLNGSLYYLGGNTYNNIGFNYSFAIGGAPTGNVGIVNGTLNTSNTISFAANLKQHNVGSVFPYSGGVSGAERARTALYKSITSTSTEAGQKSIGSLGPITGGQLDGPIGDYFAYNGSIQTYALAAIAFGKNPYSTTATSILPTAKLGNYLTFLNGTTRTVTGGQLGFIVTSPINSMSYANYGSFGFAFGNSILASKAVGFTYQYSLIKNIINLAALK